MGMPIGAGSKEEDKLINLMLLFFLSEQELHVSLYYNRGKKKVRSLVLEDRCAALQNCASLGTR